MASVSEDVPRIIGGNRNWMKKYQIFARRWTRNPEDAGRAVDAHRSGGSSTQKDMSTSAGRSQRARGGPRRRPQEDDGE